MNELLTDLDDKVISASRDFMFKAIMLDKENEPFLKDIINYVSKIPMEDLENMVIENIEHLVQNKNDKKMRSDIIISISKFCINIEMNNTYYNGLFQKNDGYLNLIASKLYNENDQYVDIKHVLQINFDNFSHFKEKKEIHKFIMKEEETNEILKEMGEVYHIDMAFIRKKCYNKHVSNLNKFERACMILTSTSKRELYKYAGDDEMLKKVADKIVKLSSDEKMMGLYDADEQERKIRNTLRYNAVKEGLEKGMQKGMQQGIKHGIQRGMQQQNIENAKKMLDKGIKAEDISEITNLSIDAMNNLK